MTSNKSDLQCSTLLHFWNQGIHSPKELHKITGIPLSTVKYNIKKIKETGNVSHRGSNGRPKKLGSAKTRELERYIRKDSSSSLRTLAIKLSNDGDPVSHMTIGRRLKELGYKSVLPTGTSMLMANHKTRWIE